MDSGSQPTADDQPVPTPRVNQTIASAALLARAMGHDYLGTEHLLLALLDDHEGIAGQVLNREGNAEGVRRAIEAIIADPAYAMPSRRKFS